MKSKSISNYIYLGTCLRYLQDAKQGRYIHHDGMTLENINKFLRGLDSLDLHVTKRASSKLRRLKKELSKKPKDARLTATEAADLKELMSDIRKTFFAEVRGHFIYIVTDKRLDVNKLVSNVDKLFKPVVYSQCPEIARYDFQEAGLCVAFERPTAAAFHLLRGTEAVLRIYYKKYIRPAKSTLWGPIVKELRDKTRGKKPDPTLINNLDNIRNSFRNPTQHPEKIYDIQEVQDLFGLCIDVVNRMISATMH